MISLSFAAPAAKLYEVLDKMNSGFRSGSRSFLLFSDVEAVVASGTVETERLPVDQTDPVGAGRLAAARAAVGVEELRLARQHDRRVRLHRAHPHDARGRFAQCRRGERRRVLSARAAARLRLSSSLLRA